MIQLLVAKMMPPPGLAADVNADFDKEPKEQKAAPDAVALLGQLVSAMNPPKRKRMSITAPSGAVYQGDISEDLMPSGSEEQA
jgi:hypothetical protein